MSTHVRANRRYWDEQLAEVFGRLARDRWAQPEPVWGIWNTPQSQLPLLPAEVAGLDAMGLHRLSWPDEPGVEFYLPHGERIRLLRACGLAVEDLIEVQAPAVATNVYMAEVTAEWSRRWPSEEAWIARRE